MPCGQRRGEIGLEGILQRIAIAIRIAIGHIEQALLSIRLKQAVSVCIVGCGGDQVGERQHPLLVVGKGMLIVHTSILIFLKA